MRRMIPPGVDGQLLTYFRSSPQAGLLLGASGEILDANTEAEKLIGKPRRSLTGMALVELVPPSTGRAQGRKRSYLGLAQGSLVRVVLHPSPGGLVACLSREISPLLRPLLELGQRLSLSPSEEEAAAELAGSLRQILPGYSCAVRLIDEEGSLSAAVAHGSLDPDRRGVVELTRKVLQRCGLGDRIAACKGVTIVARVRPIFRGTGKPVVVPLVAGNAIVGLMNLEPEERRPPLDEATEEALFRMAPLAAASVRSARLISELSSVRSYLERLIERANALILVVDGQLKIRVFNRAFCELSGFARDQVIGRDLSSIVPEADRRLLVRAMAASLRGEAIDHLEIGLLTAAGSAARVAVNTAPLLSANGAIEGIVAIGQDLTRFRELERQVVHAEKLASVGRLAAGIVHELNNPLTSITMNAEALTSAAQAPGIAAADRSKIAKILEASQRLLRFTRELLTYAKPATSSFEAIDIAELLAQSVAFCELPIRESRATVELSIERDLPFVAGVRSNLTQVFVNLITNACHALDGPGTIELSARRLQGQLEVRVRDEGRGIPSSDVGRIFEPFFTTKADGRGTGLGLSIVQGIVTRHGGSVAVHREDPRGTSFTVRLPLE